MPRLFLAVLIASLGTLAARGSDYSGTLPVMFVTTQDTIDSKSDYVAGTFYIEANGCEGIASVGSERFQLPLLIRGRGNWTWSGSFAKKSYKIKLDSKMGLLSLGRSKHFALLAHADGGSLAFFRNTAGFALSRLLGLAYTPGQQPLELVVNGDYVGLYFLTETVRVEPGRVAVEPQESGETDADKITGGWLIELDNNINSNQVRLSVRGTNLSYFLVTYHTPDSLSNAQRTYLRNEMSSLLATVYDSDKSSAAWEEIIDTDTLARFYLINEVLDNFEAFYGSCYLHKDRGEQKWKFGPLWDMGSALSWSHNKEEFSFFPPNNWGGCIMEEIYKFPRFREKMAGLWQEHSTAIYDCLTTTLTAFTAQIAAATVCDNTRWPNYGTNDVEVSLKNCLAMLQQKRNFLEGEWGNGANQGIATATVARSSAAIYSLSGQRLTAAPRNGLYIKDGRKCITH